MRIDHHNRKDIFHQSVGERLREVREQHGWSIAKLAKACGVGHSTVYNAEIGHSYSFLLAALVAQALDVTMDDLTPIDAVPSLEEEKVSA